MLCVLNSLVDAKMGVFELNVGRVENFYVLCVQLCTWPPQFLIYSCTYVT